MQMIRVVQRNGKPHLRWYENGTPRHRLAKNPENPEDEIHALRLEIAEREKMAEAHMLNITINTVTSEVTIKQGDQALNLRNFASRPKKKPAAKKKAKKQ